MPLAKITIIPAAAGSGKTHHIQTEIAVWIKKKQVDASRVLAVTFTEAAAAELRQRIRAELIANGMIAESIQLNQAMISTIHGFGLSILTDYCLEGGLSPAATLLTDEEQTALIRSTLSIPQEGDAILADLYGYGYRYDFMSGNSASDQFRKRILQVIATLRVLGRESIDVTLYQAAEHYLKTHYGNTLDAAKLNKELHSAVTALLKKHSAPLDSYASSESAQKRLRANYKALQKAQDKAVIASDWSLWLELQNLQKSNRNFTLPVNYDDLADAVMLAAGQLKHHPGPLEQALTHLQGLFKTAEATLNAYQHQKQQAGLLDYTDMLALADQLLQNPLVLKHLASRFDCLVIDEFQDTNPLQFSLLYRLQQTGIPTLIVGDTKQAIMRFQHADARLMNELENQSGANVKPLTGNWRSQKALMPWINAIGKNLFGGDYQALTAKACFRSKLTPLEIVAQEAKSTKTTHHLYTALRIKALLDTPEIHIFDKKSGQHRPIKGSDIAVLHPRSAGLKNMADALRQLGVSVRIEAEGWFASAMVQLLYYALSYVVDTSDRHAALYLVTSECGHYQLQGALDELVAKQDLNDPVLTCLDNIAIQRADKTVTTLLQEIIVALDLYTRVSTWADGKQARAAILRLVAEAENFVSAPASTLSSAGIYGHDLKSFLVWLSLVVEQNDAQPQPQAVSENAVQLVTWHSSKGREWPVVAVCGLESNVEPRFPTLETGYTSFKPIGDILKNAQLLFTPKFLASETQEQFANHLLPALVNDAKCLLYVALTRAREQLILEWSSHQLKNKFSFLHVLLEGNNIDLNEKGMCIDQQLFEASIIQCGKDMPKEFEQGTEQKIVPMPVEFRAALQKLTVTTPLTPESISPSLVKGNAKAEQPGTLTKIDLTNSITLHMQSSAVEKGSLMHRALEILNGNSANQTLLQQALPELNDEDREQICAFCQCFETWLEKYFKPKALGREVPFLCLDQHQSVVSGQIDLLVETKIGYWIIDYKSDRGDDLDNLYQHYRSQLFRYVQAVTHTRNSKPVLGMGIVWLRLGKVWLEVINT